MMKNNKEVFKIIKNDYLKYLEKKFKNFKIKIPNDPSSAAFFTALTLLTKNQS